MLLILFGAGIVHLLKLRLDTGDVYPPYSSLRADPLGTKAFYESLTDLPQFSVQRYYEPLHKLDAGKNTTLLFLGTPIRGLEISDENEAGVLEKFMREGGRIVVCLTPEFEAVRPETKFEKPEKPTAGDPDSKKTGKKNKPKKIKPGEDEFPGVKQISLLDRWNLNCQRSPMAIDKNGAYEPFKARPADDSPLQATVPWHSAVYFTKLTNEWRVLYTALKNPVVIERDFGAGSLVVASDSYFLSNEALRKDRQPELLVWTLGANSHVLFDETHLGLNEQAGVATLILRYRLYGAVIAFILLAGLFIWKNATSFVPPHADDPKVAGTASVAGRDAAAGFINWLGRGLPAQDVISLCLQEWKKSCARSRPGLLTKADRIQAVVDQENSRPPKERNPVQAYATISQIVAERK